MISQRIEFEKLLNTRDLGGMTASGGRKIRPGKLIRSGHLYPASANDREKLAGLIDISVDFRSLQECEEKPEPVISGIRQMHIPIFEERKAGVTRDEDSFMEVREKMLFDASVAETYMRRSYERFVTSAYSVSQYGHFIRLLLERHDKAVLWHCTAGKDRAGFATVIIQELLGVSREDIAEDYMLTNVCLEPEIRELTAMLSHLPGVDPAVAEEATAYVFSAKTEYLDAVYRRIAELYGSFDGFITEALHITPAEREQLKEIYLEP